MHPILSAHLVVRPLFAILAAGVRFFVALFLKPATRLASRAFPSISRWSSRRAVASLFGNWHSGFRGSCSDDLGRRAPPPRGRRDRASSISRTISARSRCRSRPTRAGPERSSGSRGRPRRGQRRAPLRRWREASVVRPHADRSGRRQGGERPCGIGGTVHKSSDGWGGRIRTSAWRYQKPLPYRLATPHRHRSRRRPRPSVDGTRPHGRPRRSSAGSSGGCPRRQRLRRSRRPKRPFPTRDATGAPSARRRPPPAADATDGRPYSHRAVRPRRWPPDARRARVRDRGAPQPAPP